MSDIATLRRRWWLPPARSMLACLIVAALLGGGGGGVLCYEEHFEVSKKQVTLQDVCNNAQVPIISIREFERLVRELEKDDKFEICPNRYRQAFTQLEPIVSNKQHLVCGDEKFELIKEYHFRYVNPKQETYEFGDDLNHLDKKIVPRRLDENPIEYGVVLDEFDEEARCPIALQQFFKAYVMQVSGLCKEYLIENIDQAMRSMNDDDYNLFSLVKFKSVPPSAARGGADRRDKPSGKAESDKKKEAIRESDARSGQEGGAEGNNGALSELINKQTGFRYGLTFRELVYMPELEGELEKGDTRRNQEVVLLDLRDKPELNKFMRACEKRFKPVYSRLVMPIVRLAKLGYDYVGRELDRYGGKLKSDSINTWLMITLTCESHGRIKLVASDTDKELEQLEFEPTKTRPIQGDLWIKGADQLAEEFRNSNAHRLRGFQKFLHDSSVAGRKFVAAIDPHQFAWYRRNQNTIGNGLNTVSILTNLISIAQNFGILRG